MVAGTEQPQDVSGKATAEFEAIPGQREAPARAVPSVVAPPAATCVDTDTLQLGAAQQFAAMSPQQETQTGAVLSQWDILIACQSLSTLRVGRLLCLARVGASRLFREASCQKHRVWGKAIGERKRSRGCRPAGSAAAGSS